MSKPFKPSRKEIVNLLAAQLVEKLRVSRARLDANRLNEFKQYEAVSQEVDAELTRISEAPKIKKLLERYAKLGNATTAIVGDGINVSVSIRIPLASPRLKELMEKRARLGAQRGNTGILIHRIDEKINYLLGHPEAYLLAAMKELPEAATPLFEKLETMFDEIVNKQIQ